MLINRMNTYRARADKVLKHYPTAITTSTWRNFRYVRKHHPYGWTHDGNMWVEGFENAPGHRETHKSIDVINLRHTGWYVDNSGDMGTVYGVVTVLRLGKWAYVVPGTAQSDCDADFLYFNEAQRMLACEAWDERQYKTSALEELMDAAARWADQNAERDAAKQREENEIYQAEQYCEKLKDDIESSRTTIRELITEIRASALPFSAGICAVLQHKIRSEWELVQSWRAGIQELTEKPYMISEYK